MRSEGWTFSVRESSRLYRRYYTHTGPFKEEQNIVDRQFKQTLDCQLILMTAWQIFILNHRSL